MIDGVLVIELRQIPDERGRVMHMLRRDDPHFTGFGEVYFSMIYPGVVKGWHRHRRMTLNYAVAVGAIKLVLYDDRLASATQGTVQEVFLGDGAHRLVVVPPGVWNGFTACGERRAVVVNCASEPHDPEEIERLDPHGPQLPYRWGVSDA